MQNQSWKISKPKNTNIIFKNSNIPHVAKVPFAKLIKPLPKIDDKYPSNLQKYKIIFSNWYFWQNIFNKIM